MIHFMKSYPMMCSVRGVCWLMFEIQTRTRRPGWITSVPVFDSIDGCFSPHDISQQPRHTLHNHIRANQTRLCQTISIIQELLPNTNSSQSQSHRTQTIFNSEKKNKQQQACYELSVWGARIKVSRLCFIFMLMCVTI